MKKKDCNKYDQNIVLALKKLDMPMRTFDNHKVLFGCDKRNESIFEHIANKKHRFSVSDIMLIPEILLNENSIQKDKKKDVFRNYVGRRTKKNEKTKLIKIITRRINAEIEEIISIYLIKKLK